MERELAFSELTERYDAVIFDAYGVLVDGRGALPHAAEALRALERRGKRALLATNDASRLPATISARLAGFGLQVPAESIVTAGDLLADHFAAAGLVGKRCLVLGTADSETFVAQAGGEVLAFEAEAPDVDAEVICVCDDAGFPFLQAMEHALSVAMRRLERGESISLVLPNPDLIYPKSDGEWGFTAGAIAMVIEAGLARRFGADAPTFVRLGKPGPAMLQHAARRAETRALVFIGDQLETDIAAANAAGIDAALLLSGVSRRQAAATSGPRPQYLLRSLDPTPADR